MPIRNPLRLRIAALLIAVLACGDAWPLADVVERPSIPSARAPQALLLALARAGHRLVAAGERGIVLLSDDNGGSWRQAQVPVSVTLTSVHFIDASNGWITGHSGVLLHTSDAGQTWSTSLDGTRVAGIVLDGELAKGAKANPAQLAEARRLVADGPDKPLMDVHFVSPESGFVVGAYGLFLHTEDGGRSWRPWQARLANLKGRHLTRIASVDGSLYVVGEQGVAYLSVDGGNTFKELASPYHGTFFGVVSLSADEVIIYGLRGSAFRVGRRGAQWTRLATPAPVAYCAATRLASGVVVLASQTGELVRSPDGGASLEPLPAPVHNLTTAMAEADDGALILAGRGLSRLALDAIAGGAR